MREIEVSAPSTTVRVPRGEELRLVLAEPVTGHQWTAPGLEGTFEGAGTNTPGAAARRVFRLRATDTADITLELRRPWENAATEHRTVHIEVDG